MHAVNDQPSDHLGRRQDFFQFQVHTGPGTCRYSFNLGASHVGQDDMYNPEDQTIKALGQYGYFVAFRHLWADKLRTQLVYGQEAVTNQDIQAEDDFHKLAYAVTNLAYRMFHRMDVAVEWN